MSKHTVNDVLRMAGHLLSEERRRTTGVGARDKNGRQTPSSYPDAYCFCLLLAIERCATKLGVYEWEATDAAGKLLGLGYRSDLNVLVRHWERPGADRDAIARQLREVTAP